MKISDESKRIFKRLAKNSSMDSLIDLKLRGCLFTEGNCGSMSCTECDELLISALRSYARRLKVKAKP